MSKTILLTGATDGIGLATARLLVSQGHNLLVHGRSGDKLAGVVKELSAINNGVSISGYIADLSSFSDITAMIDAIKSEYTQLDVVINNAGVLKLPKSLTSDGIDARFMVNTIAPYILTQQLTTLLSPSSRVINLSSAAQAPVDVDLMTNGSVLADMDAYAQSKLAITMWTRNLAKKKLTNSPVYIALNPGSLLGSKMVKEGFGIAGGDLSVGANIIVALSVELDVSDKSGLYFDNDKGAFGAAHPQANDDEQCQLLVDGIEHIIAKFSA